MELLTQRIVAPGLNRFPVPADRIDFGDALADSAAALSGTVVIPLPHLAYLHATGPDTDAFLQGQLSNDLRELTQQHAQLTSYSSPKGRVLALFTLLRRPDGSILLETQASIAAETLKRLRMFVLRAKLKLDDAGEEALAIGLAGPEAPELLAKAGLPIPALAWDAQAVGAFIVLRRPGTHPRFSVHGPAAALDTLWQGWSAGVRPAGTAAWRLLEILAGSPSIHPLTRETFVPQMLNLDAIGGISFTKGCYPGQEIVARLHYLGTAKRRMIRAFVDGDEIPAPGSAIGLIGGDGQAVGEIVDAAAYPGRGSVVLAVLQTVYEQSTALHLGPADAPRRLNAIETLI